MKLKIVENNRKKNPPSSNKGGGKAVKETVSKEKVNGLLLFNPLTYEYEENEKVYLNSMGLKQIDNLEKPHYRVIAIRQANLGNMVANVMDLDTADDPNIRNPYLAHHFSPLSQKANEST